MATFLLVLVLAYRVTALFLLALPVGLLLLSSLEKTVLVCQRCGRYPLATLSGTTIRYYPKNCPCCGEML
jgi:hypothetical protein